MLRSIFTDSAVYFLGRSSTVISGIISVPIFLHLFGSSIYFGFSSSLYIAISISAFGGAWLTQAYLRNASYPNSETIAAQATVIISLFLIISALPLFIIPVESLPALPWALLLSASFLTYNFAKSKYQILQRKRTYLTLEFTRSIMIVLVPIVLYSAASMRSVEAILAGFILGNLIFSISYFDLPSPFLHRISSITIISWMRFGFPVALWLGLSPLLIVLDRQIMSTYLSSTTIGDYAALYDVLTRAAAFLFLPIATSAYPILVRKENKGQDVVKYLLGKTYILTFAIISLASSMLMTAALVYLQRYLLRYAANFATLDYFLLTGGCTIWQANLMFHKALEIQNRTATMVMLLVTCYFVHLLIICLTVQSIGIRASPLAMFCSAILYGILSILVSRYFHKKN